MTRETIKATFDGSYDDFLRSCKMRLRILSPSAPEEVTRCWELVQRSNQLNLSNNRYSIAEFRKLLTTPGIRCLAFECNDKYGNYGIVGFASVDERGVNPVLVDFVMSCRIAQKKVVTERLKLGHL
jgi:FkbH-like protein